MAYIDPDDELELLGHIRREVLHSRFASMDEAIIWGVSNEDPGLRLIQYLDRFIGAVQEQSSRHVLHIEASLREYLSPKGEMLEGIEVLLSRDSEDRPAETVPLKSLDDHSVFVDRMREIRALIFGALNDTPRGGFRR